jgi:hypothetical protein
MRDPLDGHPAFHLPRAAEPGLFLGEFADAVRKARERRAAAMVDLETVATLAGVRSDQLVRCERCLLIAYAIDQFEITQLEDLGWVLSGDGTGDLCPECHR